jgi:hypothetical protein
MKDGKERLQYMPRPLEKIKLFPPIKPHPLLGWGIFILHTSAFS